MKRSILLALLIVALVAMPAFASVQNVRVSGDVSSTWLVRDNFDLGFRATNTSKYQNLLITQTRLRVDADLTENVSATIALINERPWDTDDASSSDVDLNLALVELREFLGQPVDIKVGRQEYAFGNSFVIDSAGTNNSAPADSGISAVAGDLTLQTAQDAIRITVDYDPLTVDLIAAKINANNLLGNEAHDDDVDLFGTNMNYQLGDDMDTVVEAYFWAKIDQKVNDDATRSGGVKADTVYMPGFRASTNPIEGLNTQVEFAYQTGNKVISTATPGFASVVGENQKRSAQAAQFLASYQVPVLQEYNPIAQFVYTYTSGDSNPTNLSTAGVSGSRNKYTAWDPMFENQGGGTIFNALFNLTNIHVYQASLQVNPMEDVTTKLTWSGFVLDKAADTGTGASTAAITTLVQPDGSSVTATTDDDKGVGYEIDFDLLYDYTEDVQLGFSAGIFVPGSAFVDSNTIEIKNATQYLANVDVAF